MRATGKVSISKVSSLRSARYTPFAQVMAKGATDDMGTTSAAIYVITPLHGAPQPYGPVRQLVQ